MNNESKKKKKTHRKHRANLCMRTMNRNLPRTPPYVITTITIEDTDEENATITMGEGEVDTTIGSMITLTYQRSLSSAVTRMDIMHQHVLSIF